MKKIRLQLLSLFFLGAGAILLFKLFNWQIIEGERLSAEARRQHFKASNLPAKRGSILSNDLFPLAISEEAYLLWADPQEVEDIGKTATVLAQILSEEGDELAEEERIKSLLSRDARWVPVKDKVSKQKKEEIEKLGLSGIGFEPKERRSYPEGSMAAHLLGFVGKDQAGEDKGYFGLEGFYDLTLSGKPGSLQLEGDAAGLPILFGASWELPPADGLTLITHIDRGVQYIAEKKLEAGIERYGAKEGTVLVMQPTGGILAAASYPAYDPQSYSSEETQVFKNPAVAESFEPGSIFKVLVMSAALDTAVVKPETKCDDCDGPIVVDKYIIKTWNEVYYPESTMEEVIVHSDNVGMAFVGQRLGADQLFAYLNKFGIGRSAGIDLQEEANPGLREQDSWSIVDLVTASFGQGVAVTPIQMLRAVAAIANNGVLPTPQVADKIVGDEVEKDIPPKFEDRVVSAKTVAQMKKMMVKAVEEGEAKWAAPRGFSIAGKTGTAQIPVAGHYDEEKTIVSFVGFAPADNPKFVMLVTLREPTSSPWGSETAAPLWFSIASELFPYFGIQPGS